MAVSRPVKIGLWLPSPVSVKIQDENRLMTLSFDQHRQASRVWTNGWITAYLKWPVINEKDDTTSTILFHCTVPANGLD